MIGIVSSRLNSPLWERPLSAPVSGLSGWSPGRRSCASVATAAVGARLLRVAESVTLVLVLLATGGNARAAAQAASGVAEAPNGPALPQTGSPAPPTGDTGSTGAADVAKFFAGAAIGLVAHEAGHLAFDYTFDASPGVKKVTFGPLPFFAITHDPLSPRREYTVASAGFWVQQLGNEVLLTARPGLRSARAPMAKGLFAFNVLTSAAYAFGAFAHAGPPERDTRTMAVFLGIDEAAVGAMILGPAVLDTVRYYRPRASWAKWASRAAKVGMVILVVKKGN
jgi:hypothetical protein